MDGTETPQDPVTFPLVPAPAVPVKNKGGRPPKIKPEITQRLVDLLRAGNYVSTAAYAVGISPSTVKRWMDAGEVAKSGVLKQFWESIKGAAAEAEVDWLRQINERKPGWQAIAWLLERTRAERFARRDYHAIEAKIHNIRSIPQDELDNLLIQALAVINGGAEG